MNAIVRWCATVAIAALLAGCQGGRATEPVPVAPAFPAAKGGPQPEILVTNYANGFAVNAVEFGKGARGNAVPLRRFVTKEPVFGLSIDGAYWSGPYDVGDGANYIQLRSADGRIERKIAGTSYEPIELATVDRSGNVLVADWAYYESGEGCDILDNNLYLYSAAAQFAMVRTLNDGGGICMAGIHIDKSGNIFVGHDSHDYYYPSENSGSILEVGPKATGLGAPERVVNLPDTNDYLRGLDTDSHGNIFALVSGQLVRYAPGKKAARDVLKGIAVSSFTLDSENNLYVVVGTYIEEFAPNATRPMRVIGGPATGLTNPSGIILAY